MVELCSKTSQTTGIGVPQNGERAGPTLLGDSSKTQAIFAAERALGEGSLATLKDSVAGRGTSIAPRETCALSYSGQSAMYAQIRGARATWIHFASPGAVLKIEKPEAGG